MHVFCVPDMDLGPENIVFESDTELNSDEEGKKQKLTKNKYYGGNQCGDIVIGRLHEIGRESRQFWRQELR